MAALALLAAICVPQSSALLAQAATPTPPATQPAAIPTIYSGDKPPIGFTGGADSIDALLDQFLAAIKAGDTAAAERLRVTKAEYCNIIVPGQVPKGESPRQTFEKTNDIYFGMMDTRSRYTLDALIKEFKDQEFVGRQLELSKGTREFAWYSAYGQVVLTLTEADGNKRTLRTGWIAAVDGRYKFIAFSRND